MLRPVAASAGLAQINAIGNLAGCGGTYLIAAIRHATRSYILSVVPLTVVQAIGCVALVSIVARRKRCPSPRSRLRRRLILLTKAMHMDTKHMDTKGTNRIYDTAVLPGDGIGVEVTSACLRLLEATQAAYGGPVLTCTTHPAGAQHYARSGDALPIATFDACRKADAILFGAMRWPDIRFRTGRRSYSSWTCEWRLGCMPAFGRSAGFPACRRC